MKSAQVRLCGMKKAPAHWGAAEAKVCSRHAMPPIRASDRQQRERITHCRMKRAPACTGAEFAM